MRNTKWGRVSRRNEIVDCDRWQYEQYHNFIYFCILCLPSTRTATRIRSMDSEKIEGTLWEEMKH